MSLIQQKYENWANECGNEEPIWSFFNHLTARDWENFLQDLKCSWPSVPSYIPTDKESSGPTAIASSIRNVSPKATGFFSNALFKFIELPLRELDLSLLGTAVSIGSKVSMSSAISLLSRSKSIGKADIQLALILRDICPSFRTDKILQIDISRIPIIGIVQGFQLADISSDSRRITELIVKLNGNPSVLRSKAMQEALRRCVSKLSTEDQRDVAEQYHAASGLELKVDKLHRSIPRTSNKSELDNAVEEIYHSKNTTSDISIQKLAKHLEKQAKGQPKGNGIGSPICYSLAALVVKFPEARVMLAVREAMLIADATWNNIAIVQGAYIKEHQSRWNFANVSERVSRHFGQSPQMPRTSERSSLSFRIADCDYDVSAFLRFFSFCVEAGYPNCKVELIAEIPWNEMPNALVTGTVHLGLNNEDFLVHTSRSSDPVVTELMKKKFFRSPSPLYTISNYDVIIDASLFDKLFKGTPELASKIEAARDDADAIIKLLENDCEIRELFRELFSITSISTRRDTALETGLNNLFAACGIVDYPRLWDEDPDDGLVAILDSSREIYAGGTLHTSCAALMRPRLTKLCTIKHRVEGWFFVEGEEYESNDEFYNSLPVLWDRMIHQWNRVRTKPGRKPADFHKTEEAVGQYLFDLFCASENRRPHQDIVCLTGMQQAFDILDRIQLSNNAASRSQKWVEVSNDEVSQNEKIDSVATKRS